MMKGKSICKVLKTILQPYLSNSHSFCIVHYRESHELLINMQSRYNMSVAKQKKTLLEKLLIIRKACAILH